MTDTAPQRNAERTKDAILEAATGLFAEHGFNGVSIQHIASAAGVARGTPNYFFGSKGKLFQAVLERESASARLVVPDALNLAGQGASPERLVGALIDEYLDYLDAHPRFLRLIQWTTLQHPALMDEVEAHWQTILSAISAVNLVRDQSTSESELRQLTLSVMGMCTFHFFFGSVIAKPLGVQTERDDFLSERKQHLKTLLTAALRGFKEV